MLEKGGRICIIASAPNILRTRDLQSGYRALENIPSPTAPSTACVFQLLSKSLFRSRFRFSSGSVLPVSLGFCSSSDSGSTVLLPISSDPSSFQGAVPVQFRPGISFYSSLGPWFGFNSDLATGKFRFSYDLIPARPAISWDSSFGFESCSSSVSVQFWYSCRPVPVRFQFIFGSDPPRYQFLFQFGAPGSVSVPIWLRVSSGLVSFKVLVPSTGRVSVLVPVQIPVLFNQLQFNYSPVSVPILV